MLGIRHSFRPFRRHPITIALRFITFRPVVSITSITPFTSFTSAQIIHHISKISVRQLSSNSTISNTSFKPATTHNDIPIDNLRDFIDNKDEDQICLKKFVQQRQFFSNSYSTYQSVSLENDVNKDSIYTYPPQTNIKQIIFENEHNSPVVGSLVEFIDITNETNFGIVIREPQGIFNENFNKSVVLTIDNELKYVASSNINFHHYKVLNPDWIYSLNILENRFNETYQNRFVIIDILKRFLEQTITASHEISSQLEIVHGQYSQPHTVASISLTELIESIRFDDYMLTKFNESYFDQCVLLMSLHLNMVRNPMWMVSSSLNFNRPSNILGSGCSNEIPYGSTYFVNSSSNCEALEKFSQVSKHKVLFGKLNTLLNHLYSQQNRVPKSFDELNIFFTIFEGRHYCYLLDVLKFLIIYPHPSILNQLHKLDVFKEYDKMSPQVIYGLLEELKIYNNPKNPLTDILLSANIMGKSSQIATSSPETLDNRDVKTINGLRDKFPHLRKDKLYYQDHVIYGLPYGPAGSALAISLEKINSRKYLINVHIPDISTKLPPSHELFDMKISAMELLKKLVGSKESQTLLEAFQFHSQYNEDADVEWQPVGDMLKLDPSKRRRGKKITSLTISFTYSTYDSKPFSNLERNIKISFDSLESVKIKNITWEALEDCLTGKAEISPFRLFRRSKIDTKSTSTKLNSEDIHNISFISSVMKSHFKIRNINGASSINPTEVPDCEDSSSISKELSIANKKQPNEKIITTITSQRNDKKLFTQSMFLINEIEKFAGNMTASFCIDKSIPIYVRNQELAREDTSEGTSEGTSGTTSESDSVLVSHNNLLLPNYNASSYYQTLIARDANGYVSTAAYLIARNYLNKPTTDILVGSDQRNIPMGMANGYVNICNPLNEFESMINQLQILYFLQSDASSKVLQQDPDQINLVRKFGYLKGYGYNLSGPLPVESLNEQLTQIQNGAKLNSFLGVFHKRFWTLKMLELRLTEAPSEDFREDSVTLYKCVVTKVGSEIPEFQSKLSTGYSEELGIEVQILHPLSSSLNVGSIVACDKVLRLDPIEGLCILREEQTI